MSARVERDQLMTTDEVAEYTRFPAGTVKGWRKRDQGPDYIKVNGAQVRYRRSAVDAWLDSQVARSA